MNYLDEQEITYVYNLDHDYIPWLLYYTFFQYMRKYDVSDLKYHHKLLFFYI